MNDEEWIAGIRETMGLESYDVNDPVAIALRNTIDRLAAANRRIEELRKELRIKSEQVKTAEEMFVEADLELDDLKASRLPDVKWCALRSIANSIPDCDEKRECEEILRDEK